LVLNNVIKKPINNEVRRRYRGLVKRALLLLWATELSGYIFVLKPSFRATPVFHVSELSNSVHTCWLSTPADNQSRRFALAWVSNSI